jgi:hypothetical protein
MGIAPWGDQQQARALALGQIFKKSLALKGPQKGR